MSQPSREHETRNLIASDSSLMSPTPLLCLSPSSCLDFA